MSVSIKTTEVRAMGETATANGTELSWLVSIAIDGERIHIRPEINVVGPTALYAEQEAWKELTRFLHEAHAASCVLRAN